MPALSDLPYGVIAGARVQAKDLDAAFALPASAISANTKLQRERGSMGTIAATGANEIILIAPSAGSVADVIFASHDSLAASDTNFLTFTLTNKGQAGSGSTVMLASSPAGTNTTKVTGGSGLSGYVPGSLVLSGTPANLVVAKNDVLSFVATATGTLANTLTLATVSVGVLPSS